MKKTFKNACAVASAVLVALSMAACAGTAADPTESTGELLAVVTDATQPEKEAFVSSSRYQATLPIEPEKPAATQPAEAETEPANTGNGETAGTGNGNTSVDPAPVAPVDPAPVEPAPTETEPPATEAPAVSLDYAAAAAYGDSYAASTYGCIIDYSLNSENAGYYPGSSRSLDYYLNNGGQARLNAEAAAVVDATAYGLGGGTFGVSCCVWESGGIVYVVVYYG